MVFESSLLFFINGLEVVVVLNGIRVDALIVSLALVGDVHVFRGGEYRVLLRSAKLAR